MEKLDFKTLIYLNFIHAKIVDHEKVEDVKKNFIVEEVDKNEVYVFKDYNEYVNFFKMYLDIFISNDFNSKCNSNELIDLAILTHGSKGQVIALKGLVQKIILESRVKKFLKGISKEKTDEIHSRGNLTPQEKYNEWQGFDLCAPGDAIGSAAPRCHTFNNCDECLMEYATHYEEYPPLDFKLILPFGDDNKEKNKEKSLKRK